MAETTDKTYVSFPITKAEETPEGHLLVYGKATDGSLDSDEQIVDSDWSAKALDEWLSSGGNVRVQHNAHRDPAGRGVQVEIDRDGDGAHWVKSLVVEPTAKELVREKVLTAYSVGIMRPQIVSDTKARGGRIVGGELGEVSLVDRPANRNCGIMLVKAAKDGSAEQVEELFGDHGQALTKVAGSAFSPEDLAKLVAKKAELTAAQDEVVDKVIGDGRFADSVADRLAAALKADSEKRAMDLDVGGGVDRDKIPAEDFVDPQGRRFPVVIPKDVHDAALSYGRGDPKIPLEKFKARLKAIAERKGAEFVAQLPDSWKTEEAELVKGAKDCPDCGHTYHADSKQRTCENCGADLPNADDADKTAEPDIDKEPVCDTCHGTGKIRNGQMDCPDCKADKGATPGDGVQAKDTKPVPAHREPDGPQVEIFERATGLEDGDEDSEDTDEPTPTWGKNASYELARLHDVLCAAYHPDTVAGTYPSLKNIADAVSLQPFQDEAQVLLAKGDLDAARLLLGVASAAQTIVKAHPAAVADARAALHKSFTDLYPDAHPTPQDMTPGRFRRPYITAGNAPLSAEPAGSQPPAPHGTQVSADDFTRGPLTAGNAAPSPAAKATSASYAAAQAGVVQTAMKELHDHIAATDRLLCPMADTVAPHTAGGGEGHVITPAATKTAGPVQAAGLSAEDVERLLDDRLNKSLADRDATIAELRRQVEELGAQPDPNASPIRGIIATKTTSGGAGIAERRSLVDEASIKEHADKVAYVTQLAKSSNPMLADQARAELERLQSSQPGQ